MTITDEMVERAAAEIARYRGCKSSCLFRDNCSCPKIARAALEAALSAHETKKS